MKFAIALLIVALASGCAAHSQVPPTSHTVTLTVTPPANSSGYSYVISRAAITGSTCPAPNVTTPNYTPLNQSSPIAGTSYVDSGAAGLTVCYIAQSVVGGAVSGPSNTAGPFQVPGNPTAPGIGGGAVAESHAPTMGGKPCWEMPDGSWACGYGYPQVASDVIAPQLFARLSK